MGLKANDWATSRGEQWLAKVEGMEATLHPVDAPLIAALDPRGRVAEVGCGGGATSREILRHSPSGTVVHGYDLSPALVNWAREHSGPGLEFHVADAGILVPAPGYDRLASRFGVMFFDDPAGAFANLRQWLVPGGHFAFAVWGRMPDNEWFASVRTEVAAVAEIPKSDPDAPGPFRYGEVDQLVKLLEGAGFAGVSVTNWRGDLPLGGGLSAPDAANFALTAFGSFQEVLDAAGPEALALARKRLTARFAEREHAGLVRLAASVNLVTGARL